MAVGMRQARHRRLLMSNHPEESPQKVQNTFESAPSLPPVVISVGIQFSLAEKDSELLAFIGLAPDNSASKPSLHGAVEIKSDGSQAESRNLILFFFFPLFFA